MRIYFNNHYMGKAVLDALLFEEMLGKELTAEKETAKDRNSKAKDRERNSKVLGEIQSQQKMVEF